MNNEKRITIIIYLKYNKISIKHKSLFTILYDQDKQIVKATSDDEKWKID